MKESARYNQTKIGYQRLELAGLNSTSNYEDYVKYYLAKDAFVNDPKTSKVIIEHPAADLPAFEDIKKLIEKTIQDQLKKGS